MLCDIRECLSVETSYVYSDNLVQRVDGLTRNMLSLNMANGNVQSKKGVHMDKGEKMVHRLKLKSGRFIDCTKEHKVLTDRGWVMYKDVTMEDSVATVARIHTPKKTYCLSHSRFMGWMLGNGSMYGYGVPSFICSDKVLAGEFLSTSKTLFGFTPKVHKHKCEKVFQYDMTKHSVRTPEGNPVTSWLKEFDMWGRKSFDKYIPQWFIEEASDESIAELLGGLWDTDGSVVLGVNSQCLSYSTTSHVMLMQILWCLNRLGIWARVDDGHMNELAKHPLYKVIVSDKEITKFKKLIRLCGKKGEKLETIKISQKQNNFTNRLSKGIGERLMQVARDEGMSIRTLGYRYQNKRISQHDLRNALKNLKKHTGCSKSDFDWLINPDIHWDRVKDKTSIGMRQVFDKSVKDNHNFVVNGIVVHNCGDIEQDADVVMFLYREGYYTQDKSDKSAELLIKKGKNCGTGKIDMEFDEVTTTYKEI